MPNIANITAPISMIAHGRSGTSLFMNILRAHPDVVTVGETAPMLFGSFQAMERVRGTIRPDPEVGGREKHNERCGKAVRAMFLASFPDKGEPRWMQKPINAPYAMGLLKGVRQYRHKAAWYWNALNTTFPDSTNLTILRHPYDVVLSSSEYWGVPTKRAWDGVVNMARILNHPASDVRFAVSHARLVSEPDAEVSRILSYLDLTPHPGCFKATERVYVPKRQATRIPKTKMQDHVARAFSRKTDWSRMDMSKFRNRERDILVALWARFGETLTF
ncbi:MAG: sulfotransferase [Pseudomonadota bacterium]